MRSWASISGRSRIFLYVTAFRPNLGPTGGIFPEAKWPAHEDDPLPSAEVKNGGAIFSLPHTSSWLSA
jgi:hypothetical protein